MLTPRREGEVERVRVHTLSLVVCVRGSDVRVRVGGVRGDGATRYLLTLLALLTLPTLLTLLALSPYSLYSLYSPYSPYSLYPPGG